MDKYRTSVSYKFDKFVQISNIFQYILNAHFNYFDFLFWNLLKTKV